MRLLATDLYGGVLGLIRIECCLRFPERRISLGWRQSAVPGVSVKVMGADPQCLIEESVEPRCLYMNHAVLVLQWAFREDELAACDNQALSLIQIGCDDDIGDASFIFHRQKDESLCCTGTLPGDDAAGGPYEFSILAVPQFLC
jgi:hypothetical protein